jgi:hypothetical protein
MTGNRHTFGGRADSAFRMITFIEAGAADRRPFLSFDSRVTLIPDRHA